MLLLIDYKKAFDLVESVFSLLKLFHYGFSNSTIQLIRNYFFNRRQMTKVGNSKSHMDNISLGVPQGSILGPLFFLIFINDMGLYVIDALLELFADETTLMVADKRIQEIMCSSN
jgi:ribonucleases P/MRP protein subunit RPP40